MSGTGLDDGAGDGGSLLAVALVASEGGVLGLRAGFIGEAGWLDRY